MRFRILTLLAILAIAVLAAAGCGSSKTSSSSTSTAAATPKGASVAARPAPTVVPPKGPAPTTLIVKDLVKGTGAVAAPGDKLTVNYVGVLYKNGKKFDSSFDHGKPFPFVFQANAVIPGWDQGLVGMKVGGRRELIIPAKLAYGKQGSGSIPPNAPLVFVIDLLKVS
jgi:FKBP-type peptidyl-prolyl cis-trans isomerase